MSLARPARSRGNAAGRATPKDGAAGGDESRAARPGFGGRQTSPSLPRMPLVMIAPKALICGTWNTADVV